MTDPYHISRTASGVKRYPYLTGPYRLSTIGGVDTGDVIIDWGPPLVEWLPGWRLPASFTASFAGSQQLPGDVVMEIEVLEGRPRCRTLSLSCDNVTGTELRALPIARLLNIALTAAVMPVAGPTSVRVFKTPEEFKAARATMAPQHERERWALTPEFLREVVKVYLRASSKPVIAVADHFGRRRPTASRWVAKARAEGYFEDTHDQDQQPSTKGKP